MNNLLDFIRKYFFVVLFVVLEGVSAWLLTQFNSFHGSVWFSAANGAVATVGGLYGDLTGWANLREVNAELTAQNISLQRETELLRQALTDATRDSTLTERLMRERLAGYEMLPAKVVLPEMGVVGGGGVVGIVYRPGPHHSLVIPVTNRKSSISCRVRGQNYFGYLQWDGQSMLSAYVDDVPRYAKVRTGQAVETSGYSAVFPPGIFVGRIRKIRNSADGQAYRLDVTLGTNFANLRDVAVITTPYKAEIDTLRTRALREQM